MNFAIYFAGLISVVGWQVSCNCNETVINGDPDWDNFENWMQTVQNWDDLKNGLLAHLPERVKMSWFGTNSISPHDLKEKVYSLKAVEVLVNVEIALTFQENPQNTNLDEMYEKFKYPEKMLGAPLAENKNNLTEGSSADDSQIEIQTQTAEKNPGGSTKNQKNPEVLRYIATCVLQRFFVESLPKANNKL